MVVTPAVPLADFMSKNYVPKPRRVIACTEHYRTVYVCYLYYELDLRGFQHTFGIHWGLHAPAYQNRHRVVPLRCQITRCSCRGGCRWIRHLSGAKQEWLMLQWCRKRLSFAATYDGLLDASKYRRNPYTMQKCWDFQEDSNISTHILRCVWPRWCSPVLSTTTSRSTKSIE